MRQSLLIFLSIAFFGCSSTSLVRIDPDIRTWIGKVLIVDDIAITYKLPPNSRPAVNNQLVREIDFPHEVGKKFVNGHEWITTDYCGYEYDGNKRWSIPNFKITTFVGKINETGSNESQAELGDWLYLLQKDGYKSKTAYFFSGVKSRGSNVMIGGRQWYHQIGHEVVGSYDSPKLTNNIVADIFATSLDQKHYLLFVFNYSNHYSFSASSKEEYRNKARLVISNVSIE